MEKESSNNALAVIFIQLFIAAMEYVGILELPWSMVMIPLEALVILSFLSVIEYFIYLVRSNLRHNKRENK